MTAQEIFDKAQSEWTAPNRIISIYGGSGSCDYCVTGAVRRFGAMFIAKVFPKLFLQWKAGKA